MRLEEFSTNNRPEFISAIGDFLPIAMSYLGLTKLPKISIAKDVENNHDQPTFGKYANGEDLIFVDVENRHPVDIIRTLAHELVHYKQDIEGQLHPDSWVTGSDEENEANEKAGIMMREFNQQFPQYMSIDAIEFAESAAWQRKAGKNKNGGLNAKGVASYRRQHPGSKLQTAVTTKPSKLKPGSKAAKRRKSFCARMSGVKGPMKKPNGKPTRKALALRKWNC
jgi:hypothetical protein